MTDRGGHTSGGRRTGGAGRVPGPRDVTKRDGRRVRFDPAKIRAAVWRAMQAVGDGDEAFAEDVTAVVTLALEREASIASAPDWTPTIETVQDRVERALVEMGRAGVAKAYILYRDRRSRARSARALTDEADAPALGDTDSVRVRQSDAFAPWSRGRIAAALVQEADLPRELASEVARKVEERVLASGLSEVSTALVRALVDHELVAGGMVDALRHTEPVALPRHDLRRLASGGGGARAWEPWRRADVVVDGPAPYDGLGSEGDIVDQAGAEVLRRFASTEVLDRRSAELHAAGDLHVSDLRRPQRFLHLGVPLALLGTGGPERAPEEALVRSAALLARTSRGLTLDEAGPLVRAVRARGDGLLRWLTALSAVATAAGQRICLRLDDARGPDGVVSEGYAAERAALVVALAAARDLDRAPRVWMDVDDLGELLGEDPRVRDAVLDLLVRGTLVPSWHRGDGRPSGPGAVRLAGERGLVATGGAVALNLPRLARRVGPHDEERMLEELFGLLTCALEAGRALAAFQERGSARGREAGEPGEGARALFARAAYALVPVGLPEALRILGDGEADPERGARILGLIAEAAARFPEPGAPRFEPCALFGAEAARRLAWTDRTTSDAPRAHQAWLFAEMSGQDALVRSYTPGYAVGATAAWRAGEAEAELVRTVPSGLLAPVPRSGGGALPGSGDHAAPSVQLERFVSLRRAALARADAHAGGARVDELLPLGGSDRTPLSSRPSDASGATGPTPLRLLRGPDDGGDPTPR